MKTLKKVATVLAVLLGLGFVLSTTSCGIANVTIDADFIENEDFSSYVGTWVITTDSNDASEEYESEEVEIVSAEQAKTTVLYMYTVSEYAKETLNKQGVSYKYTLATNLSRTVIVWKQKSGDSYENITMKKK